jgi:gliding motility-associated-like protein
VGEIWPIKVDSFEPSNFTYTVRPDFIEGDNGFDRLEILTYTTVEEVHSVKIDSREIDLENPKFKPEILPDRIIVKLDRKLQDPAADRLKQVEVNFDVAVLRFGADFQGWVFNSDDPDRLKQQIQPGNATFRFSGDVLSVRTTVGGDLLVFTETAPNPFTPNGDGINDEMSLSFKVREVSVRRSIQVEVYDLAGNSVRTLTNIDAITGAYSLTWDGNDDGGVKVPPGLYLYRINLESDEKNEEKLGSIAVVY